MAALVERLTMMLIRAPMKWTRRLSLMPSTMKMLMMTSKSASQLSAHVRKNEKTAAKLLKTGGPRYFQGRELKTR